MKLSLPACTNADEGAPKLNPPPLILAFKRFRAVKWALTQHVVGVYFLKYIDGDFVPPALYRGCWC